MSEFNHYMRLCNFTLCFVKLDYHKISSQLIQKAIIIFKSLQDLNCCLLVGR